MEIGWRKSEVGCLKSEVGCLKLEIGGLKSEIGKTALKNSQTHKLITYYRSLFLLNFNSNVSNKINNLHK